MLFNGDIVDDTYQIIREIGSGGMGVVYLAYHIRLQKYVVMKKIKGRYSDISMFRNEVDILKQLHHPYLPQVYDFITYESDIYTIIDYIDGYDLDYYITNLYHFSEGQLIKWLRQLCEVLVYLHSQNNPVIHTDIKPANIIVTGNGDICLIDFGISLSSDDTVKGFSRNYSSPEQYENVNSIISGNKSIIPLDGRTDIYSLGATFYHIICGVKPDIVDKQQLALCQYNTEYSDALVSIIDRAMKRNRDERFINAQKMLNAVNNIKKFDVRYKRYVLIQIISCVLAGILIISGTGLVVAGSNEQTKNDYNSAYTEFMKSYKSGNIDKTVEFGNAIINNSEYKSLLGEKEKADILHAVGDCFYENSDYANAALYYLNALEFADDTDKPDIYYRDYAVSLVKNNNIGDAQKVLEEASAKYQYSTSILIISAEIALQQNETKKAESLLNSCINNPQTANENKSTAYEMLGKLYESEHELAASASAYESALQTSENVSIIRSLGGVYLALADENNVVDFVSLNKARQCYEKIYNNYFVTADDGINYAQTYSLAGDFSSCVKILTDLAKDYPDDYRIFMLLAFAGDDNSDSQTGIYCQKARKLYMDSDENKKENISQSDLEKLKSLYSTYCNSVW